MNRITAHLFAAIVLLSAIDARSAATDIDPSFSSSPISECREPVLFLASGGSSLPVAPRLIRSDSGAIYVACASSSIEWTVVKFRRDGTRDSRWGNSGVSRRPLIGGTSNFILYAAEDPDGGFRIVLRDGRAMRYLSNGLPDLHFGKAADGNLSSPLFDGALYDSKPIRNHSLQIMPDGGMVSLNIETMFEGVYENIVVRKLAPDGSPASSTSVLRYRRPQLHIDIAFPGPLAWSLQADDTLELLVIDELAFSNDALLLPGLRMFRIRPDATPAVSSSSTFPAHGIANFSNKQFRVFADGSKLHFYFDISKWSSNNLFDPSFIRDGAPGSVGAVRVPGCPNGSDGLSLLADGGFVTYSRNQVVVPFGFGGYSYCNDLNINPRDVNGYVDATRPAALLTIGDKVEFTSFIDQDGSIVVLRHPDMLLQRFKGYGPRADVAVVEYYHAGLDHYFITATQAEIDDLDNAPASGWKRTGHRFGAWNIDTPMPNTETVCRFYGDRTAGPNSHFYSAEKFECDDLAKQEAATPAGRRAWRFERNGFRITVPTAGKCNEALVPVRRVYNNAWPGKDPNHRYLTSDSELRVMLAKGWVDEGVHMCATPNLM